MKLIKVLLCVCMLFKKLQT